MNIELNEVYRYLGMKKNIPDEKTFQLINESIDVLNNTAEPKSVRRRFVIDEIENDQIKVADMVLKSKSLSRNLKDCHEAIFFAATLGNQVDRMLNRYIKLEISRAVVFQAVATAAIESYCDEVQAELEKELYREQLYLRPRFSPGYGDLSMDIQQRFIDLLDATRKTGIVLSEGGVMIPEKSVTAIIGVSNDNTRCPKSGCEICRKSNCIYRR